MNADQPTTSTYRSEPGGGPADPAVRRFVLLTISGLIIVTIALLGRAEVARWHQASAENAFADQRYEDAIAAANRAIQWDPKNEAMVNLRALARMQNDDLEGSLSDLDELIAAAARDDEAMEGRDERDMQLLRQKANTLQRLERYTEAISILDEILKYRQSEYSKRDDDESRQNYAMALNNLAYTVAQAFTATDDQQTFDVAVALAQSRESLDLLRFDDPATIDTWGYLLLLNGQAESAVEQLQRAVMLTEEEQAGYRKRLQQVADQRALQMQLLLLDQQLAVILHHRGEAYAAIGETDKSNADIAKAKQLGYDPEKGIW